METSPVLFDMMGKSQVADEELLMIAGTITDDVRESKRQLISLDVSKSYPIIDTCGPRMPSELEKSASTLRTSGSRRNVKVKFDEMFRLELCARPTRVGKPSIDDMFTGEPSLKAGTQKTSWLDFHHAICSQCWSPESKVQDKSGELGKFLPWMTIDVPTKPALGATAVMVGSCSTRTTTAFEERISPVSFN
jgi:hypothetical protein